MFIFIWYVEIQGGADDWDWSGIHISGMVILASWFQIKQGYHAGIIFMKLPATSNV